MKNLASTLAVLGLAACCYVLPAQAAPKTVTLSVPGMTCVTCPITVKKALDKVEGVEKTEVSFEKKEAVVTFDDAKTKVKALMEATKNAGYPATVKR
jgi:mercuric ion binding protein